MLLQSLTGQIKATWEVSQVALLGNGYGYSAVNLSSACALYNTVIDIKGLKSFVYFLQDLHQKHFFRFFLGPKIIYETPIEMYQCKRILSLLATNTICTKLQMHFASRIWSQPQVDTILSDQVHFNFSQLALYPHIPKFCITKNIYRIMIFFYECDNCNYG